MTAFIENSLGNMAHDIRVLAKGGHPLPVDKIAAMMSAASVEIMILRSEVDALDPENGPAADRLRGLMSDISQICEAAQWLDSISTDLDGVEPGPFGLAHISERQAKLLKSLRAEAGGWWTNSQTFEPNA